MAQIKYNRLIALGCSHTYGHGLEDCFFPPHGYGPEPSKLAWPNQLSQLLEIEQTVNLALPGCSNKYICHAASCFDFKPTDLVVVLWTYNDRTGIFKSQDDYYIIAHWKDSKYSKKFIKSYYSNYDISFQNSIYINYLKLLLKQKNTDYFYDFLEDSTTIDSHFVNLNFDEHRKNYGSSLDGYHMDSQGHSEWAKLWYNKIQAHQAPVSSISNH